MTRRAAAAALLGLLGFVVLTALVLRHPGPLPLDSSLHRPAIRSREPVVGLFVFLTTLGTSFVVVPLLLLGGVVAARRTGVWWLVLFGPVLLITVQAIRYLCMVAVDRPRPPEQDWARHASGESFPSGHTTTAAVAYVLLLLLIAPSVRNAGRRGLLALLLLTVAGLVGVSRVVLGVHWPTDVLGGWSLSLFLLPMAAGLLRRVGSERAVRESLEPCPDPMPADPTSSDPSPSRAASRRTRSDQS